MKNEYPKLPGSWVPLDEAGRIAWLDAAHHRFFKADSPPTASNAVVVNGRIIDDLLGFFCAFGEAVNGPGGYFGRRMPGFDDCLFGGFGLELPYTITWTHSARSRIALGSDALVSYLATINMDDESIDDEGHLWFEKTSQLARAGERTLFDEIVDAIESVPERFSRPIADVQLRLV